MSEHEDFGRKLIWDLFGKPPAPMPDPPKFSYEDVCKIRDHAISRFVGYPSRHRLDGMRRDLSDDDKRAMAYFEAVVEVLNNKGVVDRVRLEKAMPHPFTANHEVLDEGIVGHTFTQQKK